MHILILPAAFVLWYFAYEAKPVADDEVTHNWEKKNTNKRIKLLNIINESFQNQLLEISTIPYVCSQDQKLTAFDKYI